MHRKPVMLVLGALVLLVTSVASAASVSAQAPFARGTIFHGNSGLPWGYWGAYPVANEFGYVMLIWSGGSVWLAYPCAVAADGQVVLEAYNYPYTEEYGIHGLDEPTHREGTEPPGSYIYPEDWMGQIDPWLFAWRDRVVFDPNNVRSDRWSASMLVPHYSNAAGPDYGYVEPIWEPWSLTNPATDWGSLIFGQAWSPLGWHTIAPAVSATIDIPPHEGWPFYVNEPPFNPFTGPIGLASCPLDPLPRPVAGLPADPDANTGVQGVARHALTGQPIAGATVSSEGRSTTTGTDGRYRLAEVPPGPRTVTASMDGFVSDSEIVNVQSGAFATQAFALVPAGARGEVRIVLRWGETPQDLDSHLWVGSDEIYFASRGSLTTRPFAALDVDDTSGFGPETITISGQASGQCVYAVHNYSGEAPISTSGARVQVYFGDQVVATFTPPEGATSSWWHVFNFACGTTSVSPVNTVSNSPPPITRPPGPTTPPPPTLASPTPIPPAATATPAATGGVTGRVTNATNNQPISGATVTGGGRSATTGADGSYQLIGLSAGNVQVTGAASGFISVTQAVAVPSAGSATANFALSQVLATGETRIVLTWGATPRDLDSHLWLPNGTEIYFGSPGTSTTAQLDVDDTDGFGPETITIRQQTPGTYIYSVHNFSGDAPITGSQAVVRVFRGNSIVQEFGVPTSGTGTWWRVFIMDGATGTITPVNTISNTGR